MKTCVDCELTRDETPLISFGLGCKKHIEFFLGSLTIYGSQGVDTVFHLSFVHLLFHDPIFLGNQRNIGCKRELKTNNLRIIST